MAKGSKSNKLWIKISSHDEPYPFAPFEASLNKNQKIVGITPGKYFSWFRLRNRFPNNTEEKQMKLLLSMVAGYRSIDESFTSNCLFLSK